MEDCSNKRFARLQYVFSFFIILYPILGLYGTPFRGVSIADFLMILFTPFLFIILLKLNKPVTEILSFPLLGLLIFLILQMLLIIPFADHNSIFDILMSSLRLVLYFTVLTFFTKTFFKLNNALQQLRYVSVGASLYLILQYICYTFLGIYLPGTIPFLNFMSSSADELYQSFIKGYEIRVCSVFSEPSHFSSYVVLFLIIDLLLPKKKAAQYINSIIVSVALLLSKSSTGIIMCLIVWFFWMFVRIMHQDSIKRKLTFLIGIMLCMPMLVFLLINTSLFQSFLSRTYTDGHLGNAALGRVGNVSMKFLFSSSSVFHIFFGYGLIDLKDYLPGLARWVYSYGIIGLITLILIILALLVKSDKIQKSITVFFLFMNVGTNSLLGIDILLYFPFIILSYQTLIAKDGAVQHKIGS